MNPSQIAQILQARKEAKAKENEAFAAATPDLSDFQFNEYLRTSTFNAGLRIAYEHTLNILGVEFE